MSNLCNLMLRIDWWKKNVHTTFHSRDLEVKSSLYIGIERIIKDRDRKENGVFPIQKVPKTGFA